MIDKEKGKEIYEKIKEKMMKNGLNYEDVAKKLEVSRPVFYKYLEQLKEGKKINNKTISRLIKVFELPVHDFMVYTGESK